MVSSEASLKVAQNCCTLLRRWEVQAVGVQQRKEKAVDEGASVAFEVREDLEGTGGCEKAERGKEWL